MRLIDADKLKEDLSWVEDCAYIEGVDQDILQAIDNAPTVERPQGICKTCKYYYPYYKQFSSEPRGDGYCGIQRMTPEGIIHINCNDEFGCLDYQKGDAE